MTWQGMVWAAWRDHAEVRARLDGGADPNTGPFLYDRPLHMAAECGSPAVVEELAGWVDDIDALSEGRSALWVAVYARRADNARALVAAGADPDLPMMAGWSPGRLSQVAPDSRDDGLLSATESAAVAESRRLVGALGTIYADGTGLACVSGVSASEVIHRLGATAVDAVPDGSPPDRFVGVTDVPGGCVVTQPWGYAPRTPAVMTPLSVGTFCYSLYANPKSGNQGAIAEDGEITGWDLHPGGDPEEDDSSEQVLAAYLYQHNAVAYSCAAAGLRLTDARAVTGPPDVWLRLD